MKATSAVITVAALLLPVVKGHPGDEHVHASRAEIQRRQLAANARHIKARSCASAINEFHAKRRAARALATRDESFEFTITSNVPEPHFETIQNTTCVTAPEVTEGPYYVRNEHIRRDLREDQGGVPIILDIGVIDTTTCKPLPNAFVELWAANATGHYSSFTTLNGGGLGGPNGTFPPNGTQPGGPPGGGNGTGGPPSQGQTDSFSWLRGGWPTNKQGVVELTTIYPGFYSGRTVHIHTGVITDWSANRNGTINSGAGHLRHIGQIFFDETLNTDVLATAAYQNNTQQHTLNDADGILAQENTDGYNAFATVHKLGKKIEQGLLGYITIGVDTSAEYKYTTQNYWNTSRRSLQDDEE